jgi:hypothetical protein
MAVVSDDESETVCRAIRPGKDNESYTLVVHYNDMKKGDWEVAAAHEGDLEWKVTKNIAWNFASPEVIKFVYCDNLLMAVLYCMGANRNCGWGYKGHGMVESERLKIHEFFFEVDDEEDGPYVYARKPAQPK